MENTGDDFDAVENKDFPSSKQYQFRGNNLNTELLIDFREAVFGTKKQISFSQYRPCQECVGTKSRSRISVASCRFCKGVGKRKSVTETIIGSFTRTSACDACDGIGQLIKCNCEICGGLSCKKYRVTLEIDVPAGVEDGSCLRVVGFGDAGKYGGQSGDLYIKVRVNQDQLYKRNGTNIHSTIELNQAQVKAGCELEVETIDGPTLLTIPPNFKNNKMFRIKGRGVPHLGKLSLRGDHLVSVNIR